MKKRELLDLLSNIDDELLEGVEKDTKSAKVWVKWSALAACLCIVAVIGVGISMPLINIAPDGTSCETTNGVPQATPDETELRGPEETSDESHDLLKLPVVQAGNNISDKTEINIGGGNNSSGMAEMAEPAFRIRTVIEAEVIEVLPDEYYSGGGYANTGYVARLRIKDVIAGSDLPAEIYLRYSYYGKNVFDGFDSFIFSLDQIGVENYTMINKRTYEVEYFPNMFDVHSIYDLGYGSVLAFKDGIVAEEFTCSLNALCQLNKECLFEDRPENKYPAKRGNTVDQVKENIRSLINDESYLYKNTNTSYITPEKLFVTEEAMALRALTSPESGNIFIQQLYLGSSVYTVRYKRLINGFSTNEIITLSVYSDGRTDIERSDDEFTPNDLENVPDLSEAIKYIEADTPTPTHVDTAGYSFYSLTVTGKYRKVDGRVWGIVRLRWQYKENGSIIGYLEDDMYYLYDSEGNGRIVERDELRAVIGDDSIILNFPYGLLTEVAT